MTEGYFRKIFELKDDYSVGNETIDKYNLYVEGCKLLFKHLTDNINNHVFSVTVDGRSFDFKAVKKFERGYSDFIKGYTSNHRIELYVKNSGNFKINHEWLSGRDVSQSIFNKSIFNKDNFDRDAETDFMIKLFRKAYRRYMDSELYDLINRFKKTHGITVKYDYFGVRYLYGVGASSPIKFSGVKFHDKLFVYRNDERVFLSDYDIKNVIDEETSFIQVR